jgi:hypothetical protein
MQQKYRHFSDLCTKKSLHKIVKFSFQFSEVVMLTSFTFILLYSNRFSFCVKKIFNNWHKLSKC